MLLFLLSVKACSLTLTLTCLNFIVSLISSLFTPPNCGKLTATFIKVEQLSNKKIYIVIGLLVTVCQNPFTTGNNKNNLRAIKLTLHTENS